ncbi:MAG: VOC family protein [Rhodospirillales bacterium]
MAWPVFQLAYVTAELERAMVEFSTVLGIGRFQVNRDVSIETGAGAAYCHFALAFLGEQQIELIEPVGGMDGVYRDVLAPGRTVVLHHLGFLLPTETAWRAALRGIEASGHPMPVRGIFGDLMHYAYVDRRDLFAHYLEYMYATPAGATLFDNVPRFPAAAAPSDRSISA